METLGDRIRLCDECDAAFTSNVSRCDAHCLTCAGYEDFCQVCREGIAAILPERVVARVLGASRN